LKFFKRLVIFKKAEEGKRHLTSVLVFVVQVKIWVLLYIYKVGARAGIAAIIFFRSRYKNVATAKH
jgi:hypothetical protein